uniref:DnaJ subfamily C member 14 n=1 Tax=Anthurium amnicola TaxID=1678845 RepID=A0A1D1Z7B8_9ARAE
MARRGNQQRNGLYRGASNHKYKDSDPVGKSLSDVRDESRPYEGKVSDSTEVPNGETHGRSSNHMEDDITNLSASRKKNNKRSGKGSKRRSSEEARMPNLEQSDPIPSQMKCTSENDSLSDSAGTRGDNGIPVDSNVSSETPRSNMHTNVTVENASNSSVSSDTKAFGSLSTLAARVLGIAKEWFEMQKPRITTFSTFIYDARDFARIKIEQAYPIVWTWILHIGKLILLLSMVWLDCSLRGLDSLLRLGTSSFFVVVWCSFLSVLAMVGLLKMFVIMVIAGLVLAFIGLAFAILVLAIFATMILWIYGSFWTTGFAIFVGGVSFALNHEKVSLFIATVYSVYSAKSYVGWLGLLLGFNLSFISGDVLIYLLKNKIDDQRFNRSEQGWQSQRRTDDSNDESRHDPSLDDAFPHASGRPADRGPGMPSTSGSESEFTSEDEIIRLLNCNDHYSVLGLARYEAIDASHIRREYRRKAMLVHPDKNMGNENAVEAFKRLQNAYEVLLDSLKRKTYDDELRREELLNYLRRLQTTSQKNGKHGIFTSGSSRSGAEDEVSHEDSRRISCKKCGDFHIWAHITRSKSRARWCQECKDFHQAKDGDGWVEQSFQPLLFGLLHKMEPPIAYVCADSRIYDATEWFTCQGIRCPANTHKPSFLVNTNVASKYNNAKGSSSVNRGSSGGMPTPNMEQTMSEEEFFEWLQTAVQSGVFDTSASNESPNSRNGSSKGNVKKKRKGKKQR